MIGLTGRAIWVPIEVTQIIVSELVGRPCSGGVALALSAFGSGYALSLPRPL